MTLFFFKSIIDTFNIVEYPQNQEVAPSPDVILSLSGYQNTKHTACHVIKKMKVSWRLFPVVENITLQL